ncbi:MAG TPA: hypothetical protein VGM07_04480 [Stellaceae bacterium]
MIVDPHQAQAILADGHADWVALARALRDDPRWPWRVTDAHACPPQYRRARPDQWPGAVFAHSRRPS